MLLRDRSNLTWAIALISAAALAVLIYVWAGWGLPRRPGGSSMIGLLYGILGAALIVFECLLWLRRTQALRTFRWFGSARLWMRLHLILGLLCVPIVVLHSGIHVGGWLTTTLAGVFSAVIASGITGVLVQQWLPRMMRQEIADESIHSQIESVMHSHAVECARLIDDTCGLPKRDQLTAVEMVEPELGRDDAAVYRTAGRHRAGRVHGVVVGSRPAAERVEGAEPLRDFFRESARDYLVGVASRLSNPEFAKKQFADLRARLPEEARAVLDVLEIQCDRRRELDRQLQLHFYMHGWLWLHTPLSAALLILLLAHIVTSLRY